MMMMSFDERIGRKEEDKEIIKKDYKLQSTNPELVEIREENQKLKELLEKTMKDYKSLQSRYLNILQQEQAKRIVEFPLAHRRDDAEEAEELELISLRLGTTATGYKKEEQKLEQNAKTKEEDRIAEEGLSLGTTSSTEQSNYHMPSLKDDPKERWPPSKVMKGLRGGDEEESVQPPVKKARVSVRARCETPTMNDGCQWRKYGQKTAKGNPCPRAYYRCTVAPSCPVRKQVQRNAEDMSILITTYEGTHNHSLPPSATAMASTTSAAASMLISGSSTSNLMANNSTTLAGLSSLDSNNPRPRIYFSNCYTNPSPYSAPSHPTITLDLTSPASQPHPPPPPPQFNYFSSHSSLPLKSWNLSKPYLPMTTAAAAATTTTTTITTPSQIPMTDTIAKAITSDPSFRSALAAAITSYVGVQGGGGGELQQGLGGLVPAKYLYRNLELN